MATKKVNLNNEGELQPEVVLDMLANAIEYLGETPNLILPIYPVISLIAVPIYFVVFVIFDLCVHKKGERFYNKLGNNVGERNV